jgi:hypothetical protein
MTGWFFFMVWLGGVFAMPDRKIGFALRIFWPTTLGEWLHAKAIKVQP